MLTRTIDAATELFDATEAKIYLKVGNTSDDALITELITSARQKAESYTGRAFITQTWELRRDGFGGDKPEPWWDGVREGPMNLLWQRSGFMSLEKAPVIALTSFEYYDLSDTLQTVASTVYGLDTRSKPGRVYLKTGQIWPSDARQYDAVKIVFTAGYGAAGAVPSDIKTAVKQIMAHMYEHRGDGEVDTDLPGPAKAILAPYVLRRLA